MDEELEPGVRVCDGYSFTSVDVMEKDAITELEQQRNIPVFDPHLTVGQIRSIIVIFCQFFCLYCYEKQITKINLQHRMYLAAAETSCQHNIDKASLCRLI